MKLKSILGIAAVSALALSSGANAAWFGHGNDASNTGDEKGVLEAPCGGAPLMKPQCRTKQQERTGGRTPHQARAVDVLRRTVVNQHLQPGKRGEAEDPGSGVEHDKQERPEGAHPAQDVLNHHSVLSVCLGIA